MYGKPCFKRSWFLFSTQLHADLSLDQDGGVIILRLYDTPVASVEHADELVGSRVRKTEAISGDS